MHGREKGNSSGSPATPPGRAIRVRGAAWRSNARSGAIRCIIHGPRLARTLLTAHPTGVKGVDGGGCPAVSRCSSALGRESDVAAGARAPSHLLLPGQLV